MPLSSRITTLQEILISHSPLMIAYSGGVDSSLLSIIARRVLKKKDLICIFIDGPEVSRDSFYQAGKIAYEYDLPLKIIPGIPFPPSFASENPPDRCGICKRELFSILKKEAELSGSQYIADGANTSDLSEHRPGIDVFSSCGVIHPFIMSGISKADIREYARSEGFFFWNQPSSACLYSRIPYGDPITREKLTMIEEGEKFLVHLGIPQVRIRHHGTLCRIEVPKDFFPLIVSHQESIADALKKLGFLYITLDIMGYRSGSMDEIIISHET